MSLRTWFRNNLTGNVSVFGRMNIDIELRNNGKDQIELRGDLIVSGIVRKNAVHTHVSFPFNNIICIANDMSHTISPIIIEDRGNSIN